MVSPGVQYLAHLLPKFFAVPFLLHIALKIWIPRDAFLLNKRWVWVLVLVRSTLRRSLDIWCRSFQGYGRAPVYVPEGQVPHVEK